MIGALKPPRLALALSTLSMVACGGSTPAPVEPTPSTPPSAEPTPEPADTSAPTVDSDTPPPESPPAKNDPCQRARNRIVECTKNDTLANDAATECKSEFGNAPKPAEELARCLEELGCKALAKSTGINDGAIAICFVAAKRKLLSPDEP